MHFRSSIISGCIIIVVSLFSAVFSVVKSDEPEGAYETGHLIGLIEDRLSLAHSVARSKWNSGAPIDSPQREAVILENVEALAKKRGLDTEFARRFFEAQFSASKYIQRNLHLMWEEEGATRFDNVPDLAGDLHPKLDEITSSMIDALADLQELICREYTLSFEKHIEDTQAESAAYETAVEIAIEPLIEWSGSGCTRCIKQSCN